MSKQVVRLQTLDLYRIGGIEEAHFTFNEDVTYLDEMYASVATKAMQVCFGNRNACDGYTDSGSRLSACVTVNDRSYEVRVRFGKTINMLHVKGQNGEDCTKWYCQTVSQTEEEQELFIFSKTRRYPARLYEYRDPSNRYHGNFKKCTDGIGTLEPFREDIRRFVRSFEPHRLDKQHAYLLCLEKDGRFQVRADGKVMSSLSESQQLLYQYWCFLHLRRFWLDLQENRNLYAVKTPIMIDGFFSRLDESINTAPLLEAALSLSEQVIVFV